MLNVSSNAMALELMQYSDSEASTEEPLGMTHSSADDPSWFSWQHSRYFQPSTSAFHQTEWVDINTISITLVANAAVFLLGLAYFWSSRRHYPGHFSLKRHFVPEQTPADLPSTGFFSWIRPLMAKTEEEVLGYAGFDAAIFLRFYSVAFKIFAVFSPYALLLLIPINIRGVTWSSDSPYASNINTFNRLSMSNIQHHDPLIWLHALGMYLLTAVCMYFLVVEYRHYTNMRHRFLRKKAAHLRTIVVEGVPTEMRSDSKLFTYFNTLYPDEVVNVHIPQDLSVLKRLIRKRQAVLDSLSKGLARKGIRGEEQYHYTGIWCCRRRVNTVGYCSQELDRLNLAIATEQDKQMPRRRRGYMWGQTMPSISSVDMNYEIGTKPNREAGPIERVVLQEGSGEGSSDCDSDRSGRTLSSSDVQLASLEAGTASTAGADTHQSTALSRDGDDEVGVHRDGTPNPKPGTKHNRAGIESSHPLEEEAKCSGKGCQRQHGTRGGSGGWGSPPSPLHTPRLRVDLINVDPVSDMVKHVSEQTAQTLQNIRAHNFYVGGRGRGYGAIPRSGVSQGERRLTPVKGDYLSESNGRGGGSASGNLSGTGKNSSSRWRRKIRGSVDVSSRRDGDGEAGHLLASRRRVALKKNGARYSSRAFVTFRSFCAATTARQVLHCARPGRMAASSAPEPRDVFWPNVIVTRRQHTMKRLCVEILLVALMIFFPVIVTLLSFVFSSENLQRSSQVINAMCRRSSLFQSLIELIQPLALMTVMSTLPTLLRWVGHFEGILADSWNQMHVLSRFFTFQVMNVFLVTTIAGSAIEIVTRLVHHPSSVFTLLGETLPKVCGFFCDYVIIRTFTGMSMELVRAFALGPALWDLITCRRTWGKSPGAPVERQRFDSCTSNASSGGAIYGIGGRSRVYTSGTPGSNSPPSTSSARIKDPGCFFYGQAYAQDLLVVVVVMTYACVAPVVLIPALMFFSLAKLVYRHQLLYVYVPTFESGGSFFPKMFRRWIFALFTAQATMVGMCLLKKGFNQACSIMFLMVLTYAYKRKVRSMYEPVSFSLPLEIARGLDLDRDESGPEGRQEDEALHPEADEYLQPELREPSFIEPESTVSGDEVF